MCNALTPACPSRSPTKGSPRGWHWGSEEIEVVGPVAVPRQWEGGPSLNSGTVPSKSPVHREKKFDKATDFLEVRVRLKESEKERAGVEASGGGGTENVDVGTRRRGLGEVPTSRRPVELGSIVDLAGQDEQIRLVESARRVAGVALPSQACDYSVRLFSTFI
jgi:hypothetical protein